MRGTITKGRAHLQNSGGTRPTRNGPSITSPSSKRSGTVTATRRTHLLALDELSTSALAQRRRLASITAGLQRSVSAISESYENIFERSAPARQNLEIEYRFADAQYGRLPALVAELVLGRVAVIVFGGARGTIDDPVWRQLRTSNILVVFNLGIDPVPAGLARSLNRPGGNFTRGGLR